MNQLYPYRAYTRIILQETLEIHVRSCCIYNSWENGTNVSVKQQTNNKTARHIDKGILLSGKMLIMESTDNWKELEKIWNWKNMLNEVTQVEKDQCSLFYLICGSKIGMFWFLCLIYKSRETRKDPLGYQALRDWICWSTYK